ncbi:MAG: FkbM family methyltransferase [Cyanobacteria bacterium]|nr:FkbM family methyltransferase [Cyanobacteriota bacterium]
MAHWLSVLQKHPRPARLVAARFLEWTGLSPLFTVKLDGYRLRFYPTNVSANLWINAETRVHGLALFKDYCKAGDVAVDVGANVGEVSVILSRRAGASGHVYSFEPNPRIYRYLVGNLTLNQCGNVTPANLAVGAAPGTVRMSDEKYDDMNRVIDDGHIEVTCTTLDAAVPDRAVAFLKIDVEGSELRVLEGARHTLSRTACVNCEMGEDHYRRYGYGMKDLIAFLRAAAFQTYVTTEDRALRAIDASFMEPGGHEIVGVKDPADFVRRTGWRLQ